MLGTVNVPGKKLGNWGKCTTAAATQTKEVSCSNFTELVAGATITVGFTYADTHGTPKLKVNDFDAKNIVAYGMTPPQTGFWENGATVTFVYNGSAWVIVGGSSPVVASGILTLPAANSATDVSAYSGLSLSRETWYHNTTTGLYFYIFDLSATVHDRYHLAPTIDIDDTDVGDAQWAVWNSIYCCDTQTMSPTGLAFYFKKLPATSVPFTWERVK